jgi:hypothetical protein
MAGRTEFDGGKFKELVLLLTHRSADDPRMSRVKLNKLLYLTDFEAFRRLGRSITGATYVRGEHGPMAAELPGAEQELGQSGYLSWRIEPAGQYQQKIPMATEQPDASQFNEDELAIIDHALSELLPHGGKGAREWSHEESAGWNLVTEDGEPIPYETAFISMKRPDDSLFRRAKQLARDRKWSEVRP